VASLNRAPASRAWTWLAAAGAGITVLIGVMLFVVLGKDPVRGLSVFFWEPVKSAYALGELMVKATPLLLIALGLAVCFRSNVWNIGAEGQFIIGAVAAAAWRCWPTSTPGAGSCGAVLLAGVLGGMAWAGITALLRDRFNANEILVSLMLVYVATSCWAIWSTARGRTRRATTFRRRAASRRWRRSRACWRARARTSAC
jgi:ABC-type uncharacterized transport system permease subunit